MKILFIPGNSPYPIFSHAPLATSARNAGHQVFMGGIEWVLPNIASVGLPPVEIAAVTEQDAQNFMSSMPEDQVAAAKAVGGVYARIAVDSLDALLEMAKSWRPDIVVGGGMFYCAPLLAHYLGVPSVRLEWDRVDTRMYYPGAIDVLQPVLDDLGLDQVPEPDLWIDVCPPSLRAPDAPLTQLMRWIPGNPQKPLEPWMYTRGERPRVYITAGTRLFSGDTLRDMARNISELGAEVVIGAPERVAAELRTQLTDAHVGWVPLDVVAPTCDIIMHSGGGGTDMTALHFGVPQLIVNPEFRTPEKQRLADYGAAIALKPEEENSKDILAACKELLSNSEYRNRAHALSQEMTKLPPHHEIVETMEGMVAN